MATDRAKPPIEPQDDPDTTTAAEPDDSGARIDADDRPSMTEHDGVEETPV